ncbi:MAG: AAA-like domain-containing protein [Ardenticatenaceae bacterium]
MRQFSSYGPVNTKLHYYVPREALIEEACTQLMGENPDEGGHYITVWAPRQRGKSWVMQQTLYQLQKEDRFDTIALSLQHLRNQPDINKIVQFLATSIIQKLDLGDVSANFLSGREGGFFGKAKGLLTTFLDINPTLGYLAVNATLDQFHEIFRKGHLKKPLILILDEFDALSEEAISGLADVFRNMYVTRQYEGNKATDQREYLLHGVALIGVRGVLGIENKRGSPFNVQRSLHIPNLTQAEVQQMYQWYERESGQQVEEVVIKQVYDETQGQPGFVSWFGELLTKTYNEHNPVITSQDFEFTYSAAVAALPNANIQNIISKAKQEPYQDLILKMFQTDQKLEFWLDDPSINFLYMNGVVDQEVARTPHETRRYLKFPSPFVQKRLFHYFSRLLTPHVGQLHPPFEDLSDIVSDNHLNIKKLMALYERYLRKNQAWLFRDAPRRTTDLRIFEAVYHFNLYMYLSSFLQPQGGLVYPEFPTGNGQIDLIIKIAGQKYGLEVKSYANETAYQKGITQAAKYGKQLELPEISLIFFVEAIDDANRQKYEITKVDEETGVRVEAIFVATSGEA